jgi:hypothetical protein
MNEDIKVYCDYLRDSVELSLESGIQSLQKAADYYLKQIDDYQKSGNEIIKQIRLDDTNEITKEGQLNEAAVQLLGNFSIADNSNDQINKKVSILISTLHKYHFLFMFIFKKDDLIELKEVKLDLSNCIQKQQINHDHVKIHQLNCLNPIENDYVLCYLSSYTSICLKIIDNFNGTVTAMNTIKQKDSIHFDISIYNSTILLSTSHSLTLLDRHLSIINSIQFEHAINQTIEGCCLKLNSILCLNKKTITIYNYDFKIINEIHFQSDNIEGPFYLRFNETLETRNKKQLELFNNNLIIRIENQLFLYDLKSGRSLYNDLKEIKSDHQHIQSMKLNKNGNIILLINNQSQNSIEKSVRIIQLKNDRTVDKIIKNGLNNNFKDSILIKNLQILNGNSLTFFSSDYKIII